MRWQAWGIAESIDQAIGWNLDDYGWNVYRTQKDAEDARFAERGRTVIELPTGQGMVVK